MPYCKNFKWYPIHVTLFCIICYMDDHLLLNYCPITCMPIWVTLHLFIQLLFRCKLFLSTLIHTENVHWYRTQILKFYTLTVQSIYSLLGVHSKLDKQCSVRTIIIVYLVHVDIVLYLCQYRSYYYLQRTKNQINVCK